MQSLWKKSKIGELEITHWRKHLPQKILEAISAKPIRIVVGLPKVSIYPFGKMHLALRAFSGVRARQLFKTLQETARKRSAVLEMPVALIAGPENALIATVWKKNTRTLEAFLSDPKISSSLKKSACINAMKKTASLCAAGFAHGHLQNKNMVADQKGRAGLVDYTFLEAKRYGRVPNLRYVASDMATEIFLSELSHGRQLKQKEIDDAYQRKQELEKVLVRTFQAHFRKYKKRRGK